MESIATPAGIAAVIATMFDTLDDVPEGIEALGAQDPAVVAPILVHLATSMLAWCRRRGIESPESLVTQVGEVIGEGKSFAYIAGLLVADDDRNGAPHTAAALAAEETDVESILFVLLVLLVLSALIGDTSVARAAVALGDDALAELASTVTCDPPSPAAIAAGLVLPSILSQAEDEVGRAAPAPGFDIGSITGPSPDPEFERALVEHLRADVSRRSLRQAVADRSGMDPTDPLVERVCGLIG